jgi:hypothetical protein
MRRAHLLRTCAARAGRSGARRAPQQAALPGLFEWRDFHANVTTRTEPASSAVDFRQDGRHADWRIGTARDGYRLVNPSIRSEATMAKDHGSSVKDDKQYEGLRKKGMSKQRAARIANDPDSSSKGGKASGSGKKRNTKSQGGTKAQKAAAGRKGGKKSSS